MAGEQDQPAAGQEQAPVQVQSQGPARGHDPWELEARELRRREVKNGRLGSATQLLAGITTVMALVIGAFAAVQAVRADEDSAEGLEQQLNEARFQNALNAMDSDDLAQRATRYVLMRRYLNALLASADTAAERSDASLMFGSSLNRLANEILAASPPAGGEGASEASGRGYGIPPVRRDILCCPGTESRARSSARRAGARD